MTAPNDTIGRRRTTALLVALSMINLGYGAALIWLAYVVRNPDVLDSTGLPVPDFAAFWAAGRMVLEGTPALAYDWQAHRAVEIAGLGYDFSGWMPWHYPPPFQVVLAPLAELPLWPAMAVWCLGTLGLYLYACWRILPDWLTLVAALAVAPTAMILINGQTGFVIAAILGLALIELDRQPFRAGLLLGLIGFKPHLLAAIPLTLLATGRWRVIAGGLAMLAVLVALSWAALGGETWTAFRSSILESGKVFAGGGVARQRWEMGASVFSGLRVAGTPYPLALAVHALAALAVLAVLIRAWRDPAVPAELRAALLCYGTLAITPRVLSYDLHILLIGALFQVRHALARGWFPGEQLLLAIAALGAFLSLMFAPGLDPILPLALFAGCWLGHGRGRDGGPE